MTSTNDGKEVKSYQTSGPKSKTYFIELYKSLEARLSEAGTASERTKHLCEAWRRVYSLCQHSAPTTHPHLLSWLQRHTARTVLQTKWQSQERKDDRTSLEEAITVFIVESRTTAASRDGDSPLWEAQLVARGEWFKKVLENPWKHPVLNCLLNPDGTPPTDSEVLEWLKEERGVTFVMRLHTLVAEKCDDIAMSLATAVMERVRSDTITMSDVEQSEEPKEKPVNSPPNFGSRLKEEAGFTVDVWEMLMDMEFVLLHKRDSSRCITLAKQTPLRSAYQLIERLQSRLETSPREKRLWKNSKEVAVLIAQVVIARCMVVPVCAGAARSALYCCARSLARLAAGARLPQAAAALAAPAPTAAHLHTLAAAVDAQLAQINEPGMKPFVCELYVRAITAGMNELERLKLKTEKDMEARSMEQTLASWFVQLGCVLGSSDRVKCECALTAFSVHPSQQMYERIKAAPPLPPINLDVEQASIEATNPEFGSWASDSRGQSNFVKTSETLNMKARQNQANVLSTAILSEGEALGLSPELCQDITVLLSGPRVKTLSWDMDRDLLLENCRAYLERTHGGTKAVTTELKYLNLNPDDFQYLPEEDEDESNIYYGIEKGYEHLVESQEPEDIWEDAYEDFEKAHSSNSSEEFDFVQPQRRKKTKKHPSNSEEDDPLSLVAETKRKVKKERPHSKERSKEKKKAPGDPLDINEGNQAKKDKPKRERKKKTPKPDDGSLASLVGMKVGKTKKQVKIHTDSDADSQRSSIRSMNSEDVLYDGMYSMDDMRSPRSSHSSESMQNNEFSMTNRRVGITYSNTAFNRPYRPSSVGVRIASPSPSKSQSPSDHSRNNSPTYISDEVKSSITKLLEFRRQKALEAERKKPNAIIRDGSIAMDKINISPKGVAIPEIPKSYISKQNDQMTMLQQKVDDILNYRNPNAIPSPVIQYASKTSPNKPSQTYGPSQYNNSQADRMPPSDRCFSTPPVSDRFLDSVNLISIYDKNEPTHSRDFYHKSSPYYHISQERQSNVDMSHLNYKDYLHEFSLSSYNQHMEKRDAGKKVMRPISRVTPVVPNVKSEPKTPQSAKQTQQKKPDGSLNTFSRLSYYKNKQTDMRKSQDMSQHNQPQTVGSKLDGFIMNHLRSQSAAKPLTSPSNDFQALMNKYDKPHTSARDHPMLSNILQGNLSKAQIQQRPVTPPKSELSDKDHNDLLLLLRQQNALNKPQNPPVTECSKTVTNNTLNDPIASSSKSIHTEYSYDSNASIVSSNFAHSESTQIDKTSKAPKKVNKGKMINVLSTSIIKTADQITKDPKPKPASTKKPSQGKPKNTEGRPKKAAAKPESHKRPEEWENVMNAILKQKTPCRGPNALDMALNKSSFEKAFEDSLRKPTNLFTAPNTSSDKSNISITEFNHETFVNITNSIAAISTCQKTPETEKTTQPILNIPKRQPMLKNYSKTKKPAPAPTVATLLKQYNIEGKTIDKLMQYNQIEVTKRSSSTTKIDIPKMTQKPSIIEKSAKTVPQRHIEMPKTNVQQSDLNMLKKTVKENKLEVPKKYVKQTVGETPKKEIKQAVDIQIKQSNYVGQRQNDPFISGIPNSDYDLLDELMDDDLRKEIGELSSDEETYNARGFLKHTINDEKNVTSVFNHERKDIASKAPPVVRGEINSRPVSKQNEMTQLLSQKPMQQSQNNKQPVLVTPAKPDQNIPVKCLNVNVKNVTTHVVTKPTQAYSNASLLRSNQITVEPNIYITTVPRPAPVKNVMLIPKDLVYEGFPSVQTSMQTVPNIAPNTYIGMNNASSISVYQATQFAAPVLSPLIITHANNPPIVAAPVVNNITCDTTVQPKPVTIVNQTEYKDIYLSHELRQPPHLATAQGNIVVDGNKLDTKAASSVPVVADKTKTPADENVGKSGERKVLKEVQGKHADEKIDCTKRSQKVGERDLKPQADKERLEKKRLAILNRKISYFCGIKTIALGYSPIEASTQKEKEELDVAQTNYVKDDLILSNQNDLQELSDGMKSPATPDSYKENKNEPVQVRRILLRSANKFKSKISTPSTSPKLSLEKKLKGSLDSPNEIHGENDQSDIETQNKPKRVSKRIRNKCVVIPGDIKDNETKVPNKKDTGTPKVPKKNVHKDSNKIKCPTPKQDFDTDNFFDIEAALLGSTIPKIVTIDNSLDLPEISLPNPSGEKVVESLLSDNKKVDFSLDSPESSVPEITEEVVESLMPDKKKEDESLPIQEYQHQHGKDLSVNKTTKSVEQIKSFKETRQSTAVSESDLNARNKTEDSTEINDDPPETTDVMYSTLTEIEKVRKENNESINEISVKKTFSNEDKVVIVTTDENDKTINDVTVKETIPKEIHPIPELVQCDRIQTNEVNILNQIDSPKTDVISIPRKELTNTTPPSKVHHTILNQVDSPKTDVISIPRKELANTTPPSKVYHMSTNITENEVVTLREVIKDSKQNSAKADSIDENNGQIQKTFKNVQKVVAPQSLVTANTADDDDDIQIVDDISCLSDNGTKNIPRKSSANSIAIENIVTSADHTDPLKKTVRIRLGNGKTFKGTISGSADVNNLLEDPKIKSLLMSQFEQPKRLYSLKLNVNKEVNGNTILSTQIIQRPKPQKPFETVSLISDDEEDENVPQVFETEYGKHKINSIDDDIFKKHQTKLQLRSFVSVKKLSLAEENAINMRSKTSTKNINSNKQTLHKCIIPNDAETMNLVGSPSLACDKKSYENKLFSAIPSKYVQGIFNDIESILTPEDKLPTEEPIVLIDDSSNDSVDIKNKFEPKEKIDELKHMLLKDLGVVDNLFPATSGSTEDVEVVLASEAIDLTDDLVVEPIVDKVDDKPDYQKIINKKCFVKLVRCDRNLGKPKCQPFEVKDDNSKENYNIMPAQVSHSGLFSILEELSTDKHDKKTEHKRNISSPVMEIYDLVASLKSKFPTNRNIQDLPSILPLKCDTEWTTTKNIEYLQCLNDMTKELQHISSSESIKVPKLATLILSYIQRVDLLDRYNFVKRFYLSPISLKRKTYSASLPIAKISKLVTPVDENRSNDCSRSPIHDLSATDASDVTIVDDDIVDDTDVLMVVTTEELESEEELSIAQISKLVTPVDDTLLDDCSRSSIRDLSSTSVAASNATKLENTNDDIVDDNDVLTVVRTEELKTENKLPVSKISKLVTPVDETLSDNCSRSSIHNLYTTDASDVLIVDGTDVLAVVTTEELKSEEELTNAKISKLVTSVDETLFDDCSRSSIHDLSATSVAVSNATKVNSNDDNIVDDSDELAFVATEKLKTEEKSPIAQIFKLVTPVDETRSDDCKRSSTFNLSASDASNVTIIDENDDIVDQNNDDIDVDTDVLEAFITDEELKTEEKLIDDDLDLTPDLSDTDVTNMTVSDCNDIDDFELIQKETELDNNFDVELFTGGNSQEHKISNIEKVVTVFRNDDDSVLDAVETETREESMIDITSDSFKNDLVEYTEKHTLRTSRATSSESSLVIADDIPIDCSGIVFGMKQIEEYYCLPELKKTNSHDNLVQDGIQLDSGIKEITIYQNNVVDESNTADDSAVDAAEVVGDLINTNHISQSEISLPKARERLVDEVTTEKKIHEENSESIISKNKSVQGKIAKEVFDLTNNCGTVQDTAKGKIAESDQGADHILCQTKIIQGSSETCINVENHSKNQSDILITSPTCGKSDLKATSEIQNTNESIDTNLLYKVIGKHNPENSLKLQINCDKPKYYDKESKGMESECLEITDEDRFDSIVTKIKNKNTITNRETKSKSKVTHFPQTNDEIVDALNKMFGEPEVVNSVDQSEVVIINHSENKASSLSNDQNKFPSISNIQQKCIFDQQISAESTKISEEAHIDDTFTKPDNSNQNGVAPQTTDEIVHALKKIFGEPEDMDSMDISEVVINEKLPTMPNGEDLNINAASEHHDDAINVSLREGLSLIQDSDCETVVESIVEMLSDEIIHDITIDTLKSNICDVEEIEGGNIVEKNIITDSDTLNVAPNNENVLSILDQYLESNEKLKGIGTRYVFSVIKQISDANEQDSRLNGPKDNITNNCDNDEKIEHIQLIIPKRTYSKSLSVKRCSRNMKRKKDMSDFKTNERKYRKGKNIDYPKITASSIAELAYAKEYKRIIDYCSTIKFSYARPFHIDSIDVFGMLKSWPISQCPASAQNDSNDTEDLLYRDTEDTERTEAITDPLKQTLNEEIVNGETITYYKPIDINETNFNKGFGERSGRVIQKIETGITKLSAATLSDVKQYQPFSLSEIKKAYPNIAHEIDSQKVMLSLSSDLIKLKEKLRSVFKNTAAELNNECMQDKKYTPRDCHLSKFPFGLTSSDFIEVPDMEVVVNVVQVGQLPVNATAQNPVTCDPRVTHVSDISPSQCSDNSPDADTQATVETEYTELTTANITLPLVQEYTQNRHQSPPSQEQNSPGIDDDMNASTQTLSIVKIELMEEETSQEKPENGVYEDDFSPLPNNNVEYSFEDTSNTLFNTSVNLNTTSNTDNASNNMFNTPTSMDNSFTNIFNSTNNMENTYTNMDNMSSSTESSYTNMDNASTSMYSASPNMGNSSTEMDNTANMDDDSPGTENTNVDNTAMNMDSASCNMENSYTRIYNPLGSDSNDMPNNDVGNSASDVSKDSPINSENRPINMNNTLNMENANKIENTAYDYTYENIEDYAANIENNNNADNYSDVGNYAASVENYPSNVDDYASNVDNYATNDENYSTGVENYASNVENYATNIENYSTNVENYTPDIDNTNSNIDSNLANIANPTPSMLEEPQDLSITNSSQESKICKFEENGTSKINQIEHAMNAAGISSESVITSGADELTNLISQSAQTTTNSYSKSTPINVMTLQQALAQVLPPPLNQTSTHATTENQMSNNPVPQQVLHIVQGNSAQTVINKSNGTHLLHIVQNKSNPAANGLSLVDAGLQQGGNQLIHFVNNGNQNNAQFLKRVNLLTNLTNAQGSNEQKMIQFVCKSADGKSIQLNAGHQRSMVLRLHPTAVPTAPKPAEPQDLSASSNASNSANNQDSSQEIKSRSVYEENYAQFIQNAGPTPCQEKSTSLPKFNQVFGKQSYQENQNEINDNGLQENSDCTPEENTGDVEQTPEVNNPPLLVRSAPPETTQAQPSPTPHMKQTISPMNIHTTMHGGVIYTRQIPVNIGGGQAINLITVPSTELVDDAPKKQQTDGSFVNQEGEQSSIIKLVPHHTSNTPNVQPEENNTQPGTSNEANYTPQPQPPPVLTQMRIKLPMLSKGPHIVPGTRLVRPSFFQIQRNVIAGTNQPVYQQLVLTTAPSLGQAIRLPVQQAQSPQVQPILVQTSQHSQSSPHIPVQQVQHAPSSQHLSTQAHAAPPPTPQPQSAPKLSKPDTEPDSELSTLTLEQLREFDMVLEQVKERSVHPTPSTTPITKPTPADSTDGPALATTSVSESTQQVLYSVENSQPTNVVSYVNRKSTITSATTSFVRSPDSSGIVDTPSSSTQVHITHTVTSKSSAAEGGSAVVPHPKKKKKKKSSSSSSSALASLGSPSKTNALKPQEDEQTTQRILYILAEYKEQVENSPDKNKPAPRRRNQFPPTIGGSKRKRSHCSSRATCRREGVDMSPMHGENGEIGDDSLITLGSEDSSCGTTFSECTDCQESHSPEDTTKVVRRLTFEQETTTQITQSIPPRNVIVGDRQTITVARTTTATTAKPTTTVLMPSNYILPVSMLKGGQQIAIMTNRGPKILVGAGDNNAGALLFQRLIGPGLKPVLTRPGVRHIRLPATALHNLQAFNIQTTPVTQAQPPDSTAPHDPTPAPPDLVDTRAMSSPWQDRVAQDKPDRGPSPDCTEPWNLPSSSIADDYGYEEIVRTDNMERTVLDAIPDRYSPDMEAQRIFDKMFDVDSKKSMYDSSRCGYDIDTSDGDDKPYPQVVQQRKDGRHHRVTHVSTAALRHKYAILEHELRLQKSLSEECEDLGVDSPSASDLFPEADILFGAPSPAHEQTIDQCNTPPPIPMPQTIPQPDLDDQIATDQLLIHNGSRNDDLDLNLDDVGEIVTVGEDGIATIPTINAEEFARSHPNTTFHTEPEDGEIPPFTIAQSIKGRHITFHANRVPGTVVMAPQTTVISQATMNSNDAHNAVKFIDIDNMINSIPCPQPVSVQSVLVKESGVPTRSVSKLDSRKDSGISASRTNSKFDSLKEPGTSHRSNSKFDSLKESGTSHRSNSKFDSLKDPGTSHRTSSKFDCLKETGTASRSYSKFDNLKDSGNIAPKPLSKFDSLLTDSKLHLSNSARQVVHSTGHGTQVIRRLRYDERTNTRTNTRFHFEEPRGRSISDEVKMRNDRAIVESMGDNASSPGQPELFWDSTTTERHERRFHFSESEKVTKSPFDELLNDSSAYGPHTRLDSVIKAARPERTFERTSFEGISVSGSSDESRPLRTYPPKRLHTQHTQDTERHFTLKTTTTTTHHHELTHERSTTKTTHHHELDRTSKKTLPRCQESEGRRRTGRGLVKRGCSCCNGSSAPPKKRSRPKKSSPSDCTASSKVDSHNLT